MLDPVDETHGNDGNLADLDDSLDREELRARYYGLLQELRVVIPGVQVLLAFLLTTPFVERFHDLDSFGRAAYGVALCSALLSVLLLMTPTVLHRVGERTARAARLRIAIGVTVAGLAALGVALLSALWCITRLVYSSDVAWLIEGGAAVALVLLWVLVPLSLRRRVNAASG